MAVVAVFSDVVWGGNHSWCQQRSRSVSDSRRRSRRLLALPSAGKDGLSLFFIHLHSPSFTGSWLIPHLWRINSSWKEIFRHIITVCIDIMLHLIFNLSYNDVATNSVWCRFGKRYGIYDSCSRFDCEWEWTCFTLGFCGDVSSWLGWLVLKQHCQTLNVWSLCIFCIRRRIRRLWSALLKGWNFFINWQSDFGILWHKNNSYSSQNIFVICDCILVGSCFNNYFYS